MIDWDALVLGPVMEVFGSPVLYQPGPQSPLSATVGAFQIQASLFRPFVALDIGAQPSIMSTKPALGARLSAFPAAFDPDLAQGDTFVRLDSTTLLPVGDTYVVKIARVDGHGHVLFEANVA